MANEGVATMLRVQQYVNTIGNSGSYSVQPNWMGNPSGSEVVSCDPVDRDSELNSTAGPAQQTTLNGPSNSTEAAYLSQNSLETTTEVTELLADEYWLYKCPKRSAEKQPSEPINNWLRAVFDSPDSIFYSSRRNLLTRLEVILASGGPIDAYRFGGSVPSLNQVPSHQSVDSMQITKAPTSYVNLRDPNRRIVSAGSSDSLSIANQSGSAGTFGKVMKPKYSLPPQYSNTGAHRPDSMTNLSTGTQNLSHSLGGQISGLLSGSPAKAGSLDELDPTSSRAKIQEIARIQEDNLKADVAAMAAAAAASGRHGSHHSLASLGRRSPDGSQSRVPSAPESPHSSSAQLTGPNTTQAVVSHVHRPTIDLSSTSFASYMIPETVDSPIASAGLPQTAHSVGTYMPRLTQTAIGENRPAHISGPNLNGIGIRNPYSALPQKPTIPTAYNQHSLNEAASLPKAQAPGSLNEPRNQFGFRPIRRIPGPQYAPRPAAYLPPVSRRIPPGGSAMEDSR